VIMGHAVRDDQTKELEQGLAVPAGFIFIDAAICRILSRCRLPETRTAEGLLLNALRDEKIASLELGHWLASRNNIRGQMTGANWHSAELSVTDVHGSGRSVVRFKGQNRNLHHFAINEADFTAWLDNLAPVEQSESADQAELSKNVGDIPAPLAVATKKRGGGRKPKYAWEPVLRKLRSQLEDEGIPADGDGGQAKLEKMVEQHFLPGPTPGETAIRARVGAEIRAARERLASEVGN